jgi:hypothetical protein
MSSYKGNHASQGLPSPFLPFEAKLPEIGAQLRPVLPAEQRAVLCSTSSLDRLCDEDHTGGPAAFPAVGFGKEPQDVHHFGPGHPFKARLNLRPFLPDRVDPLSQPLQPPVGVFLIGYDADGDLERIEDDPLAACPPMIDLDRAL